MKIYKSNIVISDFENSSLDIIPIINEYFDDSKLEINEKVGIRDGHTDLEHFFNLFDYDNYILCNSTFHYWGALLSQYNSDKIITYDNQCGWYHHIVPLNWIKID